MSRFFVSLLLSLIFISSAFSTVYPSDGPLFDISNSKCAVGRPLDEVLDELFSKTTFVRKITDTMHVSVSFKFPDIYVGGAPENDLSLKNLPEITDSDSLLYIMINAHENSPNGGLNDTISVFGVFFEPGTDMSSRKVKSLWFSSGWIIEVDTSRCVENEVYNWSERMDQFDVAVLPKSTTTYINDYYFKGECPKPYLTYTFEGGNQAIVKTGNNLASQFENCIRSASYEVRDFVYYREDYYVGSLNYCPDTVVYTDTICRTDLDAFNLYNSTDITETGCDTVSVTRPWGANSVNIFHVQVNEPSKTVIDSVNYTDEVRRKKSVVLTETFVNAVGCDSVVTYNITLMPTDTLSVVPVVPDKFFTPNGDGIREFWNIENIDLYQKYTVRIYDRYGKVLKEYKGNFSGWDGVYNGYPQPSTDYWYTITIDEIDEDLAGHFTLIR